MNYEIIDFHTHPFVSIDDCICGYKDTMPMSTDLIAEQLSSCGIGAFCGSVINKRGNGFDGQKTANADALLLADRLGGRYIPGIMVDANFADESCLEIDKAAELGVKLIGELVPYTYRWRYDDKGFYEILEHAKNKIPLVSVHTMWDAEIEKAVEDNKDITFVLAHPGEQNSVFRHIELMKKCENAYLDISGLGLFRYGVLSKLISEVGAERILFGTDYPVCNPGDYVGGVLAEKISDNDKELIFSGNAKRLLGLH